MCGKRRLNILSVRGFPSDTVVKNPPANTGDAGLIPGSGRSPAGENGDPLQYSSLGNPMDRGAWQAAVHGVTESDTNEHAHTHTLLVWLQLYKNIYACTF